MSRKRLCTDRRITRWCCKWVDGGGGVVCVSVAVLHGVCVCTLDIGSGVWPRRTVLLERQPRAGTTALAPCEGGRVITGEDVPPVLCVCLRDVYVCVYACVCERVCLGVSGRMGVCVRVGVWI